MKRWNQRESHLYHINFGPDPEDQYTWAVGNIVYDLRFFAGCKRTPQRVRREIAQVGYSFGCSKTKQSRAREIESGIRAELRAFAADVVKLRLASEDVGDLVEPDARTRHEALWDCD